MSPATLQEHSSVETFFNVVETETLALFEHLSFEFLEEFDVFAPSPPGRTRDHEPPELMCGFLHCYYKDIYGIRPVERELQNTVVWLSCGFDRPPSRDAVDRFLTDLEHVVDQIFDHLVEQAARRGLLDLTYCIDSTDVRTMPADQDASKCYDLTAEEYYYGYGCTIVSTGQKIPIAAEFTESKQAPEETAIPVLLGLLTGIATLIPLVGMKIVYIPTPRSSSGRPRRQKRRSGIRSSSFSSRWFSSIRSQVSSSGRGWLHGAGPHGARAPRVRPGNPGVWLVWPVSRTDYCGAHGPFRPLDILATRQRSLG